jgi:hypothetical protein
LQIWNDVNGVYDDVATDWSVDYTRNPYGQYTVTWGVRFMDLDRNGYSELFTVNGTPNGGLDCLSQSQLDMLSWRPPGADVFHNWTSHVGLPYYEDCSAPEGAPVTGRGVMEADLDGDGDNDIIITPAFEDYHFYRNDSAPVDTHWVRVRPKGTVSAVDPVGAVLDVERADGHRVKRILYGGGDTHGQSARVVEAGLADSSVINAWLHWPSGYSQRLDTSAGFAIDTELEVTEPHWLRISERVVSIAAPTPTMTYEVFDEDGNALGAGGSGRSVIGVRSDGMAMTFTDQNDGTYVASLPHPGETRVTVVTVTVDGVTQRPRLSVRYQ